MKMELKLKKLLLRILLLIFVVGWGLIKVSEARAIDCKKAEVFKFSNDYTAFVRKDYVELKEGEEVCTIITSSDGYLVYGKLVCPKGNSDGKAKPERLDPYYVPHNYSSKRIICIDTGVIGSRGVSVTYGNNYVSIDYPEQKIIDKQVATTYAGELGIEKAEKYCLNKNEVGFMMFDGTEIVSDRCGNGGKMCKINTFDPPSGEFKLRVLLSGAQCVDPVCKKTDAEGKIIQAYHGQRICISNGGVSPTYNIYECIIDHFYYVESCTGSDNLVKVCVPNSGNAKCVSSTEEYCKDDKLGNLLSGNSKCDEDKKTRWECKETKFEKLLPPCKEEEFCQERIDADGKTIAECTTEKPEDWVGDGILNIYTYVSHGFWCDKNENSIRTAIGCIPIDFRLMVTKLLPTILGITGGISFLLMVYGFIMVSTSSGEEKKLAEARQRITAAIIGLLVSIFALLLYRLIAVYILKIPGIS